MTIKKLMRGYELDDALRLIGMHRRSAMETFLPALGLLAAGAVIGAGIGLALAPSSGRRLRQDIGGRLDHLRERVRKDSEHAPVNATSTPTAPSS
jgi:hypothetical protein